MLEIKFVRQNLATVQKAVENRGGTADWDAFSEADYLARDRFTPPEILRSNLAAVILQTKALRLGSVESFPFLDPPKRAAIRDGYATLVELGAHASSAVRAETPQ